MTKEYLVLVPTGTPGISKWFIGVLGCMEAKSCPDLLDKDQYDGGELVVCWFERDTDHYLCTAENAQVHGLPYGG